jgi:two-component system chemotaxis response regulator CheY
VILINQLSVIRTIILVDDDRTNTVLLKRLLELDGFRVIVTPDVKRARDAAENGVDAFVIDCNLAQGDDGVDLLLAVRQGITRAPMDIPIIMTSGDDRRRSDANAAGASRFLIKPYSPSKLSKELNDLMEHGE